MVSPLLASASTKPNFFEEELSSGEDLFISAQTVGEIFLGAELAKWGERRRTLIENLFKKFTITPIDSDTARIYAQLIAASSELGRPLLSNDAWIMANAKQYDQILLSSDNDMTVGEMLGVQIIVRNS